MQASKHENEEERLSALYSYDILDAPREDKFEDITRLIARICDAPIAVINLIDRDRQWYVSEIGLGVRETPLDVSICAHAILQPDVFIVPDTLLDQRFAHNPLVAGEPHLRFYAGALLKADTGQPLGTLCVLDYQPRTLTDEQQDALQILASQVMQQLDLRRLLREQALRIEETRQTQDRLDTAYRHEKQIAETLQRSLLMDIADQSFPGLEVVPLYQAAWAEAEVGGDFYDAFAVDGDKVALVVGDVAGKGLQAAARTAEVKYALRAFLQEYPYPSRTLQRLNDFLCQFHDYWAEDMPRFVVIALGIVNLATGEVVFSMAGGEPPILLRESGAVETEMITGMPLGIQSGQEYATFSWQLEPGDTLLVATDGLTEARHEKTYLDHTGLIRLAAGARGAGSLHALGEAILQDVQSFAGAPLHDDACLLLARYAGV